MISGIEMKNASYVACFTLFFICGLIFISIIVSSPPIIYTYKLIFPCFIFSLIIVGLTILEARIRRIKGFHFKQSIILLLLFFAVGMLAIPCLVWMEYRLSNFDKETTVQVKHKKITYYRNSISCYKLSLKNEFIDGNLCTSSKVYSRSPKNGSITIRYTPSLFGYLFKN